MGLLIPVEHPVRLDAQRASRLCRALGEEVVSVDGIAPRSSAELDDVLAVLVPDSDTTVSFAGGRLALDALEAVALAAGAGTYTDVRTAEVNVRVWPNEAWVHGYVLHADAEQRVAVALGGADAKVTFGGPHVAIDVATADRAAAYRVFRAVADDVLARGFVMAPGAETLVHLPAFLRAAGATVTVDAELPAAVAAALTERIPCWRWTIEDLEWDPQIGRVSTYRVAPVSEDQVAAWRAKIDAALARID